MGSDLRHCVVQDIALEMGDAPFGLNLKTKDYTSSGALVVQGKNVQGRVFDWSITRHVSDEKYDSIPRSHCYVGDLIFPKVGTIGKVGILSSCKGHSKYLLSTNSMRLKVDPLKANPLFIYYYFSWQKTANLIHTMNSKSVQPVFNYTSLKKFPLQLPDLTHQNKSALVLDALDNKIQLSRKINQTLEHMAQALFKSWFVDFDLVIDNALAANNPIPSALQEHAKRRQKQLSKPEHKRLPAHIQQLFPSEFVFTKALGWVPEGWTVSTLNHHTNFKNGYSFKSKQLLSTPENTLPVFKMGHIKPGGGFKPNGTKSYFPKAELDENLSSYLAKKGDLLMSMTDVKSKMVILGNTALMPANNKFLINQRVARLRVNTETHLDYPYLYFYTNQPTVVEELRSRANSGVQVNLTSSAIKETLLLVPKPAVHDIFNQQAKAILEQIFANDISIIELEQLRDTLLPKLMSGELRLPSEA